MKIFQSFWFWLSIAAMNLWSVASAIETGDSVWLGVVCFGISVVYMKRIIYKEANDEEGTPEG